MEGDNQRRIIQFLSASGPSHPIQIGKVIEKDSFMTSAILSDMLGKSGVKKTRKNVGNSPIYYLDGQEEKALAIVENSLNLIEKKVLKSFIERKIVANDDLSVQERFVLKELQDFVVQLHVKSGNREMTVWKVVGVGNDLVEEFFNKRIGVVEKREPAAKAPAEEKPAEPQRPAEPTARESVFTDAGGFESAVRRRLEEMGAEVLEKEAVRKGSEMNMVVRFQRPFEQRCFVKARKKKSLTTSDLSMAYAEGVERKMPVLLLSHVALSKKNADYARKKFGEMLRVVKL